MPYIVEMVLAPGGSMTVDAESLPTSVMESLVMLTPAVSVPLTHTYESYNPASMKMVSPSVANCIARGIDANGRAAVPSPHDVSEPAALV